jgi:hypothetical protein
MPQVEEKYRKLPRVTGTRVIFPDRLLDHTID